jgi:hypothetical protein
MLDSKQETLSSKQESGQQAGEAGQQQETLDCKQENGQQAGEAGQQAGDFGQ